MDLNDPRKRLQVLNQSNPSLRTTVAPAQPKISIAQPQPQQQITVPYATPNSLPQTPTVNPNQYKSIQLDGGKNKTIFGWNAAALLPKSLEKTYGVDTKDTTFNNNEEFLKYFDTRDNEFQRAFVNKIRSQAFAADEKGNIYEKDPIAAKTFKALQESGRFSGNLNDFAAGANDKLYGGIGRGILRGTDFVLPGKNTFGLEQLANEQDPSKTGTQQFSTAGRAGEKFGNVEKGVFDVASLFAGAGAAEQAASKIPMFANTLEKLSQGGRAAQILGKGLSIIPGSLGGSGVDVLQTAGRGDKVNPGKSTLIGLAADLALPVVGKGISKFVYGLRGGEAGAINRFIKGLAKSDSVDEIFKSLSTINPSAAEDTVAEVAQFIAKEDRPEVIKEVLGVLQDSGPKLTDGVYTASSPSPDSLPEGWSPPSEAGTPNDRFPKSGQQPFAPTAPETQALISDLETRANKVARPANTTRVFQVAEGNGPNSDWVFNDADSLSNFINGRANPDMRVNFYDVPNSELIPTPNGEHVFKVNGDPATLSKTKDVAEELRFTKANENAKTLVKDPVLANQVAANATSGSADSLTTAINIIANNPNKGQIRDILFGNGRTRTGLLEGLNLDKSAENALVRDITKETDPQRVTDRILQAINESNAGTITNTAEDIAKAADNATVGGQVDPQAAAISQQSGTSTAPEAQISPDAPGAPQTAGDTNVGDVVAQNADNAAQRFSEFDPETQRSLNEIMDSLDGAQKSYDANGKLVSKEKATRIAKGSQNFEAAGGGEAGVRAKLSALKGQYSKSNFEPISVSEASQTHILNDIEGSDMLDYEKLNTQNAFRKLWGASEDKPAAHDIKKMGDYFNSKEAGLGDVVSKQIAEAVDSGQTAASIFEQVAGAPRTLMTVGDASAPRQLAVSFARHPIVTTKAYLESIPQMFSGKRFDVATTALETMTDAGGRNYSEFMDKVMNIHLPNVAEKAGEEAMSSAPLLSKIPIVGKVVEASNRGMSSAVAHTRFNIAKKFIDDAGGVEAVSKQFSPKELSDLGEVLDTITGRGGKKGGFTDKHATILSNTLFSGKLWASRMNMLNPYWYYRLEGPARKEAISAAASFAASAGTILGLISQIPGVEVGNDPTSADFAKIKVGNTRFDILGGFQQNIRVAAQLATGKRTSSTDGQTKDVTASSVIGGLIEGKANPLLGYAYRMANTLDDPNSDNPTDRVDEWGSQVNVAKEGGKLLLPLPATGVAETMADQGNVKGAIMSIPGFLGAGTQTYGDVKTKDQGKDSTGKPLFKGKVTQDMVLGNDGAPLVDEKNRPIKVKFDKDATDLQKKAQLDEAKRAAYEAQFTRGQSKEDQQLMKLSDQELQSYVDNGTIDKTRFDSIQRLQKGAADFGNPINVPKDVKSAPAKEFYQKFNSMTKTDQEAWLKEPADSNAQLITTELNKQRSKGLSEYKPSNELAKAYAEFEKDINSHPEYTVTDKRNKAKAFQTFTYKLNYTPDQQDIFNEGGSSDLRYLIDQKQVGKEDLNAAIQMDNELFNSGLTGSLKFSKKFRNEFGYAIPTGEGGPNAGSDSGSGDSTPRTGITSLLPSFATSNQGGNKPGFSVKPRTPGITFKNVNLPSKSSKKVSIKL